MHAILSEDVYTHVDNGTVPDYLKMVDDAVTNSVLSKYELYTLHWACIILILYKKYPAVFPVCKKISHIRASFRSSTATTSPVLQ
jgi:hypothetical protein